MNFMEWATTVAQKITGKGEGQAAMPALFSNIASDLGSLLRAANTSPVCTGWMPRYGSVVNLTPDTFSSAGVQGSDSSYLRTLSWVI